MVLEANQIANSKAEFTVLEVIVGQAGKLIEKPDDRDMKEYLFDLRKLLDGFAEYFAIDGLLHRAIIYAVSFITACLKSLESNGSLVGCQSVPLRQLLRMIEQRKPVWGIIE
ncbi:MAG: hypothetical protein NTW79_03615 [Candidatus Berkelbacteria bacterium]|nr:hypothetical protein [Candidatus Berkelbacteria bacterium]